MRRLEDKDPIRWRDAQAEREASSGAPQESRFEQREIGAAVRAIADQAPLDEVRLAHLRQGVLQHLSNSPPAEKRARAPVPARRWRWARVAVVTAGILFLGGVAAAVSGRIIERIVRGTVSVDHREAPGETTRAASKHDKRRWRVTVEAPTQLDLSVGPDGTEVSVVEGAARVTGAGIQEGVDLTPGTAWREGQRSTNSGPIRETESPAPLEAGGTGALRGPPLRPATRLPRAPTTASLQRGGGHSLIEPPSPSPSPALEPPPVASPPLPQHVGAAAGVPVRPAPPSEATLVARALGHLRGEHDAAAALKLLDEHRLRFPHGMLVHEAALARAEALLSLGRGDRALVILDAIRLTAPGDRGALAARGELRAADGRRWEAIADFDRVIAMSPSDDLAERALYGRAVCHLRGGDLGGAHGDLAAYVERFPSGRHAGEAKRLLDRLEE